MMPDDCAKWGDTIFNFFFVSINTAEGGAPPEGEVNAAAGSCFASIYLRVDVRYVYYTYLTSMHRYITLHDGPISLKCFLRFRLDGARSLR